MPELITIPAPLTSAQVGRALGSIDFQQLARRVVFEAFRDALPSYWRRRAAEFDQVGSTSADETALACRRHADLMETEGVPDHLLAELAEYWDLEYGEAA